MKWEYLVFEEFANNRMTLKELQKIGEDGWELVSVSVLHTSDSEGRLDGAYEHYYFKRARP